MFGKSEADMREGASSREDVNDEALVSRHTNEGLCDVYAVDITFV